MQIQQLADQFWQQGYLVLPHFFDEQAMDGIQQEVVRHFGEKPAYSHNDEFLQKAATEVVPWFPQREGNALFDEVENDPKLVALSEAILGEGWQSLYCMAMFSKAHTKGQAWHQDCPPDNPARFNLNRLVYSMDITEATGGEVLVKPGSHRLGELTVGIPDEDFSDQLVLKPKKGTLVIIHGHTWHRVLPVNDHYRVSTNYRAIPKHTEADITDICVYRNMRYQFSTSSVVEQRV